VNLQISIRETADVVIVDLAGRATTGVNNDLLKRTLQDLIANGASNLLLDLAHLTQVDSSSIGTIVSTFISLSGQGGSLKLLCPRGWVRAALDAMRLLDRIPSFEDETKALASFRPRGHAAGA
jgi:anti-anti-sigma factor